MKAFWCLLKRELRACFLSPIAYVVMFFFWVLSGLNFSWVLFQLGDGLPIIEALQMMYSLMVFALPAVVALITMRLFAEERKLGMLEGLLTAPIRVPEMVLAKFFGALIFYSFLWLPVIAYAFIQGQLEVDASIALPDVGALFVGFLGMMFIGSLYLAIGLFMSSLTSNQIIAAISCFAVICGGLFLFTYMAYLSQSSVVKAVGVYYSSFAHIRDFSRGTLDSRFVVLYISYTAFFLFSTIRVLEVKRV